MGMTRSEESDGRNAVVPTQQRALWRTLSGQAHTYRRDNLVAGVGEVLIGRSSWPW